jgi:hypothetical protein
VLLSREPPRLAPGPADANLRQDLRRRRIRERLLAYMNEQQINQAELSRRLATDQPTVSRILKGGRNPGRLLPRIAQLLEVSPHVLLGGGHEGV